MTKYALQEKYKEEDKKQAEEDKNKVRAENISKELLEKLAASKGIIFLPKGGDTCPRFTIEAKILGCDLILNENVQHKDEDWFDTAESCLEYMYERPEAFWDIIEDVWNCETPKTETQKPSQIFRIITPFYNTEGFIGRTIYSLKRQNNKNFRCYMIDDCSTDSGPDIAALSTASDKRFELVQNLDKKFFLKSSRLFIEDFKINLLVVSSRIFDQTLITDGEIFLKLLNEPKVR